MKDSRVATPVRWVVDTEHGGARLDRLVAKAAQVSRRLARVLIAAGRVRVNGETTRILSRTYAAGRQIEVAVESNESAGALRPDSGQASPVRESERHQSPALQVLFEDRHLLVLNKPAGLLSESTEGAASVLDLARRLSSAKRLWLVHRLDANTSGVIVLARTRQASAALGDAFRHGRVRKDYLALCAGVLRSRQDINAPIGRIHGTRHGVTLGGKPASTIVEPLASSATVTLVHAAPRTGRTHQIRVHLAHLGHPLLGDGLYGGPRYTDAIPPQPIARTMLHAARLTLPHPATGEPMQFATPAPADFTELCALHGLATALQTWG